MPELPEVQTTVNILNKILPGKKILDVWTDYDSKFHSSKDNIKNPEYFKEFRGAVVGKKILKTERRAKNILINLSGRVTVLIHMKMTGHLLYGTYRRNSKFEILNPKKIQDKSVETWEPVEPEELKGLFNKFIHLVFTLSNGRHLAFSDMRKFAKVFYFKTGEKEKIGDIKKLGPEPLSKGFSSEVFKKQLSKRPNAKIKQALMDQELISGIGNIYSDEILWASGVHPKSVVGKIPERFLKKIFVAMPKILQKALRAGGDSMSDYRNPYGKKGKFQNFHKAYHRTGEECSFKGCGGIIKRMIIGGRGAHFCEKHQKIYN